MTPETDATPNSAEVVLIELTPKNRKQAFEAAISMYIEPCRICGEMLTRKDLDTAVWAGWGLREDGKSSRVAHLSCWETRKDDQANWAFPTDGSVNK